MGKKKKSKPVCGAAKSSDPTWEKRMTQFEQQIIDIQGWVRRQVHKQIQTPEGTGSQGAKSSEQAWEKPMKSLQQEVTNLQDRVNYQLPKPTKLPPKSERPAGKTLEEQFNEETVTKSFTDSDQKVLVARDRNGNWHVIFAYFQKRREASAAPSGVGGGTREKKDYA